MPSARTLNAFLAMALSLGAAACASAPTRWEKPGADAATTAKDEADCWKMAQREAQLLHPYGYGPSPYWAAGADASLITWQQSLETDRAADEKWLTRLCLRNKGYTPAPAASPRR